MTKRMLIDATHAEETRVVVLDGNRLEDFDVETSTKRQLKGNIYLAKVVRVEPSLQACFVEYGGNRHGFLAFSEIHPDYYQIPVADRQRLIDMEAEEARREEEEADRELEGEPESRVTAAPPSGEAPAEAAAAEAGDDEVDEAGTADATAAGTADVVAPGTADAAEAADAAGGTSETLADAGPEPALAEPTFRASEPPAAESGGGPDATAGTIYEAPYETANPPATPDQPIIEVRDEPGTATALPPDAFVVSSAGPSDSIGGAATTLAHTSGASGHVAGALAATPVAPSAERTAPDAAEAPRADTAEVAVSVSSGLAGTVVTEALPAGTAAEHAPARPEHGPGDDDPGHESDPPARRAQPLIIETETISGPIDTETSDEDGDLPLISDTDAESDHDFAPDHDMIPESPPPETIGGEPEVGEEHRERRVPPRFLRNYKIQEVIRRRQILLVQVVKEERGTKGAALTTYLSLAGRFSVLMPNSPRGGGISRKITSATDRRRLKDIISELDMPKGMGLIVRTAGANRPKPEIKRDCEYLLRLWDDIRDHTMKSVAPALIYEEASLIKRAIRDVYSRDIDEIQVDGEDGWHAAHEFMRMLMPTHAKKVQLWRDPTQPLFARYQVEAQLDGMLQPTVQLRSGGYLVINQAEALVAIDVNSGRATRERNVEEMALRTNLEAADEVARQLRLRDLAGLIVIDFIDMESKKHNAMVERRIKEALKNDRARIQVGHISHFGLLEMSRQRLRPSLAETSFILCPHCGGTGHVRSTESGAIYVLRGIEEEGSKRRSAEIIVHVATPTALYILNHKRDRLREIELRYAMRVTVLGDDTQVASQFRIDRVRQQVAREGVPAAITPESSQAVWTPPEAELQPEAEEPEEVLVEEDAEADDAGDEEDAGIESNGAEAGGDKGDQAERRRRRRRRRRGRREDGSQPGAPVVTGVPEGETPFSSGSDAAEAEEPALAAEAVHIEGVPEHGDAAEPAGEDDGRRRRGRRGGRRRRREGAEGESLPYASPGAEQPEVPPVYIGPTPANPFGGQAFDIFDVLEQAEANAAARHDPPQPVVQYFEPAPAQPAPAFGPMDMAMPPEEPRAEAAAGVSQAVSGDGVPGEATPGEVVAVDQVDDETTVSEITNIGALEPLLSEAVAETEPGNTAQAMEQEPAAEVANDVVPEPAIRPILIGSSEEAPAEKKRGWWRR